MEALLIGIIVFIVVGTWFVGYKKGLIKIGLSFGLSIVAIIASLLLAAPLNTFLKKNTKIDDEINKQVKSYISEYIDKNADTAGQKAQEDSIKKLNLPTAIEKNLIDNNTAKEKVEMGVNTFSDYVAASLTDTVMRALSSVLLFLLIKISLRLIMVWASVITSIPIVKGMDKYLGGTLGLAEGIIIVWILCLVLTSAAGTSFGKEALEAIGKNSFLNFVYTNNLISKFIL